MSTYFQGAVKSGDGFSETATGVGTAEFVQSAVISYNATLTSEATFILPKNAQILDIYSDVGTAFDSATSATLTVGSASAGSQYAGSLNAKTAGRSIPTLSAAQVVAMANISTNTTVYATVTSVGQPTTGSVRVTIRYTGGAA